MISRQKIYHIRPIYKSFVWGGDKLKNFFGLSTCQEKIGTVYHVISIQGDLDNMVEETGTHLSQFYQTHRDLFDCSEESFPVRMTTTCNEGVQSFHVHPDDEYARIHDNGAKGKVSGSFTLEASGEIRHRRFGHKCRDIEEFRRCVETEDWEQLFQYIDVRTGDYVHTPAGVIHGGKGDGRISCTFGTNGDLSYRFFDYHRDDPERPLRVEDTYRLQKFPDVPVPVVHPAARLSGGLQVYDFWDQAGEYVAKRIRCQDEGVWEYEGFMFYACIGGEGSIGGKQIARGETVFVPAHFEKLEIRGPLDLIAVSYHSGKE